MPSRTLPGLGLTAYYDLGEDGWNVTLDPDLRLLSMVAQLAVDSLEAAEPGTPTQGDSVLLTAGVNNNRIAIYDGGAWVYLQPNPGWQLYDKATDQNYQWDGTSWNIATEVIRAAGAFMDDEATNLAALKAIDQGLASTDGPTFASPTINGTVGGTAVTQSATDTTAGRLMKPGDFGIGTEEPPPAFLPEDGSQAVTGFASTTTSQSTAIGLPTNSAAINMRGFSNRQVQFFGTIGAGFANRFFGRTQNAANTWQPLVEFYTTGNLLGTVSQSSGDPTGAVIERGSNANGEYVRFADGTQICTHLQTSSGAGNSTWTYPAAFAASKTDALFANPAPLTGAYTTAIVATNTTTATFVVRDALSAGALTAVSTQLMAIGRWF